jgi:hypothetical protein
MEPDPEDLATLVLGILANAQPGTIVTVHPHGAVETASPGVEVPAYERREHLVATFVASKRIPLRHQVVSRIRQGLGKHYVA